MFGSSLKLFGVRGIDVRADVSWILIVLLVTWSFWGRFVVWYDREPLGALAMSGAASFLFFASVVVHELAHALEAQRRGVTVEGITLFVFGGATHSRFDVERPVDEFALTAVGPYSSLVLAALFGLGAVGADELGLAAAGEVLGNLGWLNLALAAFNLLPGAPLDGGRILRAAVWWRTGDRSRAMAVAANAGRVLGALVMGLGVLQFATTAGFGGIWFVIIGWFLFRAASAELVESELSTLLSDRRAAQFVSGAAPIPATVTVGDAIDRWFLPSDGDAFLVVDESRSTAEVTGVVHASRVRGVPREHRGDVAVGAVAEPAAHLRRIDAEAPASDLVETVREEQSDAIVVRDGRPLGVVTPQHMYRTLARLHDLDGVNGGARSRQDRSRASKVSRSGS